MSGEPLGRGHERARSLAALRADEPLAPADEAWLADHLEYCDACAAVAAEYDAQHQLFEDLRAFAPAPPRDLWARTSAAIYAERQRAAGLRSAHRPLGAPRPARRLSFVPVVALVAIVMVVGVGLLNSSAFLPSGPAGPTPIAVVDAADIQVIVRDSSGNLQIVSRPVSQVCPVDVPECGAESTYSVTAVSGVGAAMTLQGALSPTGGQMAVVARDPGSEGVYIIPVKTAATPSPATSGAPASSAAPSPSPAAPTAIAPSSAPPVVVPSTETPTEDHASPTPASSAPDATPAVVVSPVLSPGPSSEAPSDAAPAAGTESPAVTTPSDDASSAPPSGAESAVPGSDTLSPAPSTEATPAPDEAIQIASGVRVVGTPVFAPDGTQLAFAATPSDGSAGPDIYVWTAGDAQARPVTADHGTWLAGWTANGLLVSRVANGIPSTYLLDPATGITIPVGVPGTWLPAVSPDGSMAAWWSGSVKLAADGVTWLPDAGNLVVGAWPSTADATPQVLATGPLAGWQARWDEDYSSLAVWVDAQGVGPIGQLSLYRVMPFTHVVDLVNPMLNAAPANPDFSLRTGRLVWTTPLEVASQTPSAPLSSDVVASLPPDASMLASGAPLQTPSAPLPSEAASPPSWTPVQPSGAPSAPAWTASQAPGASVQPPAQGPQIVQVLAWSGDVVGRLQLQADGSGTVIP